MRARILIFLVVLTLDAMFLRKQPWPVVVGCATYLLVVFPALGVSPIREMMGRTPSTERTRMTETETTPVEPTEPGTPPEPGPGGLPPEEPGTDRPDRDREPDPAPPPPEPDTAPAE